MLCENCGQRKAEIHLVKVINGAFMEEDICRVCAEKIVPFNDAERASKTSFSLEGIINVSDALASLMFPVLSNFYTTRDGELKCPHCGQKITHEELSDIESETNSEKMGIVFDFSQSEAKERAPIRAPIGQTECAVPFDPKTQKTYNSAEDELSMLAQELTAALSEERYERAVEIRDRVEAIKKIMMGDKPKEE